MERTFTRILLLLSFSAAFAKYVYITEKKTWHEAQEYCRLFHTDLAPVSNSYDIKQLRRLSNRSSDYMWIGLRRNSTDREKWTWSGGGGVSTFFWESTQPNNGLNDDYGFIHINVWHDAIAGNKLNFFCYNAVVVRERKSWEEALQYCRKHHHDLASVASDTEMLLIQKELNKNETTAHVWIGLRFFPGGWLWVDKQPLSYEAWGQQGKSECPDFKLKCAALQVMGGTQSNNGTDSTLVTNAIVGTMAVQAHHTGRHGANIAAPNQQDIHEVSDDAADVKIREWEACDCVERFHFVCY